MKEIVRMGYRVAGLALTADLELPGAAPRWQLPGELPDVTIASAVVPESLSRAQRTGADWELDGLTFLLKVDSVGRFLILGGHTILYEAAAGHRDDDLPLYLMGSCLAILLGQRGLLVFYGSAFAVGRRAMVFCGDLGTGKSALAARLCQSGYRLLTDDVCSLAADALGNMVVGTDGRMLKLWQPGMAQPGLAKTGLAAQRGLQKSSEKPYTQPRAGEHSARPLGAVYLLERGAAGEAARLEKLGPDEAMEALTRNAYRPGLVSALGMEEAYFAGCAAMQKHAGVFRLTQPLESGRIDEVIGLLERHWQDLSSLQQAATTRRIA